MLQTLPCCAGYVCCNFIEPVEFGSCQLNAWYYLLRWVTTRGYWDFPSINNPNDGAVFLVAPGNPGVTIEPVPIPISTFNKRQVPSLLLRGPAYACGTAAPVPPTGKQCRYKPNAPSPPCSSLLLPGICTQGTASYIAICCNCEDIPVFTDLCTTLANGCFTRYQWLSQQQPVDTLFLPENSGQVLTYVAPVCGNGAGGPLINLFANSAFAIAISATSPCTATIGTQQGLGLASYAQLVDRGQQDGVWVGALASALIGQAPFGTGPPQPDG